MFEFFKGIQTPGLIPWERMPTYNTIMALTAGAALLALVLFAKRLIAIQSHNVTELPPISKKDQLDPIILGYGMAFLIFGTILIITGTHMTLTWPLAGGGFAFDNIVFGETSLPFGVLLFIFGLFLYNQKKSIVEKPDPLAYIASALQGTSFFVVMLGIALFGIGASGLVYQLFAAPPQEPISGAFASEPWLENIFMALIFWGIALGCFTYPVILLRLRSSKYCGLVKTIAVIIGICGVVLALFGAMNYYTHIGLIVNTK